MAKVKKQGRDDHIKPSSTAVLLSLHLVTFKIFFITCLCHFFSSRSLSSQGSISGPLTQVLATLAVLAEESLTQASVQTPSQTLL